MLYCKKRPDKNHPKSTANKPASSNPRQDTWTETGTGLYDKEGNQVGVYRDPRTAWDDWAPRK